MEFDEKSLDEMSSLTVKICEILYQRYGGKAKVADVAEHLTEEVSILRLIGGRMKTCISSSMEIFYHQTQEFKSIHLALQSIRDRPKPT